MYIYIYIYIYVYIRRRLAFCMFIHRGVPFLQLPSSMSIHGMPFLAGWHSFMALSRQMINPHTTGGWKNRPAAHRPQWSAQADGVMHCEYTYTSNAMCKSMHTHAHMASHLRQVSHRLAYGQAMIVDGTSTPGGQTIANIHTHAMQHANPCILIHSGHRTYDQCTAASYMYIHWYKAYTGG